MNHAETIQLPIPKHVIMWDIGDTLLIVDRHKAVKEFGYFNMGVYYLSYLLRRWDPTHKRLSFQDHLEDLFLRTLCKIPSPFGSPGCDVSTPGNKLVPPIQQDFLLGKLTGHEAVELVNRWIDAHSDEFTSSYQKSVFRTSCHLFFEKYEGMLKYSPLFALFKAAYLATDAQGNRINTNIIVSNWERDISRLKTNFPEIFAYSDAQIFSGIEDLAKPKPALFERAKQKFPDLLHLPWFLVDDQEGNREAASKLNITPIDPKEAKSAFNTYNLLS